MIEVYRAVKKMEESGRISEDVRIKMLNAYVIKYKILRREWYGVKGKRDVVRSVGFYRMAKGDYKDMDLRFLDLSYIDFLDSDLRGAKFYGSVLYNTGISSVRINGDEFRGSFLLSKTGCKHELYIEFLLYHSRNFPG